MYFQNISKFYKNIAFDLMSHFGCSQIVKILARKNTMCFSQRAALGSTLLSGYKIVKNNDFIKYLFHSYYLKNLISICERRAKDKRWFEKRIHYYKKMLVKVFYTGASQPLVSRSQSMKNV
jgi:hypothetical protein